METQAWDFPVEKKQIYWQNDRGGFHEVKGKKAIVRTDNDKQLSVVSNGYVVVPHTDVLAHLDPFVKQFGEHNRHVALSDNGGRMMASYTFKNVTKDVKVGDTVGFGLKAISGYDGKTAIKLAAWALRLVCLNGMASQRGYISAHFRHNEKQVGEIKFPTPEFFLETFESDINYWAALTELDVTAEDKERLEHNIIMTPGLLSLNQVEQVRNKLDAANTAWDSYNVLTEFLTHKTQANAFTTHGRLGKVNDVIDLSYIKREELVDPKLHATENLTVN